MATSRTRKPAEPAKEGQDPKTVVPSIENMIQLTLRRHIQARHPGLGFWTRNEHAQDHRLRGEKLDHVHSDPAGETSEEQDTTEESTDNQEAAVDAKDEG